MSKSDLWIFTSFNDPREWIEGLEFITNYVTWQKEACPSSNRIHYQGVILLTEEVKRSLISTALGNAHVEIPKSFLGAVLYSNKEETRIDGPWKYESLPEGHQVRMMKMERAALGVRLIEPVTPTGYDSA